LDTRDNIKRRIDELLITGDKILLKVVVFCMEVKKTSQRDFTYFQDLSREYQTWYTEALAIVRQLMPDRLDEFEELYMKKSRVKELNLLSYTISDFLMGFSLERAGEPLKTGETVLGKLNQQLQILRAAHSRVDSILSDITGILRAELFDSEIEKSRELLKANYLRAAGTIASVVLESHLSEICRNHGITFTKKILHISDYNDALKNKVYDTPTWRLIQRYNDIRILCCHAKQREPTPDEVRELVDGVEKAIKTIF